MGLDIQTELAVLGRMTAGRLRERYAEVFGEATHAANKAWLVRRIAWRLQALAEGDLRPVQKRCPTELSPPPGPRPAWPPTALPSAARSAGRSSRRPG